MKARVFLSLSALLSTGVSLAADRGTPQVADTNDNRCVFFRSVYDWRGLDDRHLVLWAPGKDDAYLVETSLSLFDLRSNDQLGFVDGDHNGQLCGYGMDKVVVPGSVQPQTATIISMKRLQPAELAQLEERYKVKLAQRPKQKKEDNARTTHE